MRAFKSRPECLRTDRSDISKVPTVGAGLKMVLGRRHLIVEIGCGVGLHPIQYASAFPDRALIAIERTSEKFARFARRVEAHPKLHDRLCAVHADAFQFMDEILDNESVDEVWILYPNPEPKKASRRWFHTPFTGRLITFLKPDGRVFLATNIESYAADCIRLAGSVGLRVVRDEHFDKVSRPTWQARTHFEKKYFERGETLFDLEFALDPRVGDTQ